jgi:hypothetical protein
VVGAVALGIGPARVAAVDARGAGIDEVLHAAVPAALQHVGEAGQVAVDVGHRIRQGVAHAGLRAEVHHALETVAREQVGHGRAVGQVDALEAELRAALEPRQPLALEPDVVVVVEVVDADHAVAARQQALRDAGADEAGDAGDEEVHGKIDAAARI